MRLLWGTLFLGTLAGCGDVQGPTLPDTSRLEYCGYDDTPCEEPSPPPETGTIVITVRVCVPWPDDPTYPYCP